MPGRGAERTIEPWPILPAPLRMPTHRRPSRPGGNFASRPRSRCSSRAAARLDRGVLRPGRGVQDERGGSPVPGTYHELPSCSAVAAGGAGTLFVPSPGETRRRARRRAQAPGADGDARARRATASTRRSRFRFKQLWIAPPNGLYGVESRERLRRAVGGGLPLRLGGDLPVRPRRRRVHHGDDEDGGDPDRDRPARAALPAQRLGPDRDPDGVFALGGTSYGMWEETLGFFVLLVPLALALGYDRMVAASIIFLGAGAGVIGSTVNPFSTGVASDAAGISIGDGIGLRIALWVVLVALAIGYVIWYARRVQQRPGEVGRRRLARPTRRTRRGLVSDVPALTGRQKLVLVLFGAHVPGDDLRLHPVERPLAGGLRQGLPAADLRRLLLPRGGRAVPRDGGRHRPDRQARRGGHGDDDHRRRVRLPRRRR